VGVNLRASGERGIVHLEDDAGLARDAPAWQRAGVMNGSGIMQPRAANRADIPAIAAVINAAAEAYRGVIPADCWHDPYMSPDALAAEIAAGVDFSLIDIDGRVAAVMGSQDRGEVWLIRHAYVLPTAQRQGLGALLLRHLTAHTTRPVLIGTWAAAQWAVDFYRRHGFRVIAGEEKNALLARYWTVPARQVENSVVLADARYPGLATLTESMEVP